MCLISVLYDGWLSHKQLVDHISHFYTLNVLIPTVLKPDAPEKHRNFISFPKGNITKDLKYQITFKNETQIKYKLLCLLCSHYNIIQSNSISHQLSNKNNQSHHY